jgi:hypothetical protein
VFLSDVSCAITASRMAAMQGSSAHLLSNHIEPAARPSAHTAPVLVCLGRFFAELLQLLLVGCQRCTCSLSSPPMTLHLTAAEQTPKSQCIIAAVRFNTLPDMYRCCWHRSELPCQLFPGMQAAGVFLQAIVCMYTIKHS